MPTIISHSVIAAAASLGFRPAGSLGKFMLLSLVCSMLPDADVIGYQYLYVPTNAFFGHRGFFHSPFFAALLSLIVVALFYRRAVPAASRWWTFLYFFLLTASHGLLDAMTNGGQGIALLSPFSNQRYFLPWTPIEVSPIGIRSFLSLRGLAVLKNEARWIWAPTLLAVVAWKWLSNRRRARTAALASGE